MKFLLTLSLVLLTFLANAQPSINDGSSHCSSYDIGVMQIMSADSTCVQCDSVCGACVAIQNASPVLQRLAFVLMPCIFVNVSAHSLSEPIITPPPIA
jgi:hypothetical protein